MNEVDPSASQVEDLLEEVSRRQLRLRRKFGAWHSLLPIGCAVAAAAVGGASVHNGGLRGAIWVVCLTSAYAVIIRWGIGLRSFAPPGPSREGVGGRSLLLSASIAIACAITGAAFHGWRADVAVAAVASAGTALFAVLYRSAPTAGLVGVVFYLRPERSVA